MMSIGDIFYRRMIRQVKFPSQYYWASGSFVTKTVSVAADRYIILSPVAMQVDIGGVSCELATQATLDLSVEATWDTISGTDYRTAANRAGKDFYIYACQPSTGSVPTFKTSYHSTTPSGYTESTSRKIGGFHCLCASVGTIANHPLTGYLTGDILPKSVWDWKHRPSSSSEGMLYSSQANIWVDIYQQSGTLSSTASVYSGTVTTTRSWCNHIEDAAAVNKRHLSDEEFTIIAEGSNVKTILYLGNSSPRANLTGGNVDSAQRRMISNVGCEDCCGFRHQWLNETSLMTGYEYGTPPGTLTKLDYLTYPTWPVGWRHVDGDKGYLHLASDYAECILIAGGTYYPYNVVGELYSGPRCRLWGHVRFGQITDYESPQPPTMLVPGIGDRFCASSVEK